MTLSRTHVYGQSAELRAYLCKNTILRYLDTRWLEWIPKGCQILVPKYGHGADMSARLGFPLLTSDYPEFSHPRLQRGPLHS
jgi:hypothetical protein